MTNSAFKIKNSIAVRRIFLTMLVPTLLMNLTTAIASLADAMIIGKYLDDASLSVVTFATPVYMIINTLAALFTVGGCIVMSIDMGKGDKKAANRAFSQSMEFLFITGLLLGAAGLFFSEPITGLLGATPDIWDEVQLYTKIILLGGMIFVFNIGIAFFVRNDGRPSLSMIGMILGIATDIALNFLFVGYMNLGVAGAAYSTVIGQLLGLLINLTHFLNSKNTLKFMFCFDKTIIRILKSGISTALTFIYQFVTVLLLNHFVVSMAGTNGVVVYTVVFNLYTVALSVFEGLSQTVQPMVGVFYGENSNRKIKQSLKLAILAAVVLCGTVTVILEIAPEIISSLFSLSQASIIRDSSQAVRIYAVSLTIMTVNVILGYYLQTIENTSMSAWLVSLRCCILFLGSVFALGTLFGLNGVWMSYTVSELLTFGVFLIMTAIKRRKMMMSGIRADRLLLDTDKEERSATFIYRCTDRKDAEFKEFSDAVKKHMESCYDTEGQLCENTMRYLEQLGSITPNKRRSFIEVDINCADKKVFIRDNFSGKELNPSNIFSDGNVFEYGPVLGWNRICIE